MARTTRRRSSHSKPQAQVEAPAEVATEDDDAPEGTAATAVAPAPAPAAAPEQTMIGMPRDPEAEQKDDSQAANIPEVAAAAKSAHTGGGGGGGGAIGKAIPGTGDKGGGMIGKAKVNAAGMTDDDDEAYDMETHEKYEQVKRSELHLVDLQRMSVQELHEICKKEGIEDYIGLKKQDLIFKILKKRIQDNGLMVG